MRAGALIALLLQVAAGAAAAAERLVSLDYCADAYLLALADRAEILALSPEADAPYSYVRDEAGRMAMHGGSTEEILSLAPGLAVRSGVADGRRARLLARLGVAVVDLGYATGLADAREAVVKLGEAVGRPGRADALLERMADRRARLEARAAALDRVASRPQAVYLTPSGVSTGEGTYIDEVFDIAGIANRLAADGVEGWSRLSLEGLAARPPEMVVTSFFGSRPGWQMAWRFSRHPVAETAMARAMHLSVPAGQWGCAGFFLLDAAESLLEGRERWVRARLRRAGTEE